GPGGGCVGAEDCPESSELEDDTEGLATRLSGTLSFSSNEEEEEEDAAAAEARERGARGSWTWTCPEVRRRSEVRRDTGTTGGAEVRKQAACIEVDSKVGPNSGTLDLGKILPQFPV
ncbi:Sorting nexin-21, partial [Ophiophagus hannah]